MRPTVDVVVPFAGSPAGLARTRTRIRTLQLRAGDTAVVVDNRAGVADVRSSYHARNQGAATGSAEWLLFLDADVTFEPDLLDRLFDPLPAERTAVLAGAIEDVVVRDTAVARWVRERAALSQRRTLDRRRPYGQTAHLAVRRAAFRQVGGFAVVRSGGDADLCFRLADAGWGLEERAAAVRHEARADLGAVLRQLARHGAGAAWLDRRYPGAFPAEGRPAGLARWLLRAGAHAARARSMTPLLDPLAAAAFAYGRTRSNEPR